MIRRNPKISRASKDGNERMRSRRASANTDQDDDDETKNPFLNYLFNIYLVIVFGYSLYFSHFDESGSGFNEAIEKPLRSFGPVKWLTYNCLVTQFLSACLHLLSRKFPKFKSARDIVFTAFAFPLSCHVFCNFWGVYFSQGREVIYPITLVPYYPNWLNQVSHTLIVPANIGLAYMTFHKYINRGLLLCLSFLATYSLFACYIRFIAGMFPYEFMNQMCKAALLIYIGSVFFCSIAFYQLGYFITSIFHPNKRQQIEQISLI